MFSRRASYETVVCPVCGTQFGQRDKHAIYKAHCDECRAVFIWKLGATAPIAILDRDIKKPRRYCGPEGCVCRD